MILGHSYPTERSGAEDLKPSRTVVLGQLTMAGHPGSVIHYREHRSLQDGSFSLPFKGPAFLVTEPEAWQTGKPWETCRA